MAANDNRHVITVTDPAALAATAAEHVLARTAANTGRVAICLTGGSSPKQLYQLLATDAYRSRIPWHRVHWFIGDERFVPANDPLNNMAMARQCFLDRCAPLVNIHPVATNAADPDEAARRYEIELKAFFGTDRPEPGHPLFDVVLMGAVAPLVPRVTLTLPVLASCHEMLFEVSGADKRPILSRVLAGEDLPAARAHSVGETVWLVDRAALPESFHGQ